jgi:hypothetical protein
MREALGVSPIAEEACPWSVTVALRVGWGYQLLSLGTLFFFYLPRQQDYIRSLASKPYQQLSRDDISLFLHPEAAMFGTAAPFLLMFVLSAWLLHKTGLGRIWARNLLVALFGFRILAGVAVSQGAFSFLDVIAQSAVVLLLLVPASRAWFHAKNFGISGGAEGRYRVDG